MYVCRRGPKFNDWGSYLRRMGLESSLVWADMAWSALSCPGSAWPALAQFDLVCPRMVWFGLVWFVLQPNAPLPFTDSQQDHQGLWDAGRHRNKKKKPWPYMRREIVVKHDWVKSHKICWKGKVIRWNFLYPGTPGMWAHQSPFQCLQSAFQLDIWTLWLPVERV